MKGKKIDLSNMTTLLVLTFGVKHVKGPEGMGKLPEE